MRVLCVCACVCACARARVCVCVCCVCAAFVRAFVRASAYCEHVVRASAYCEHVRLFRVRARVCACVRARSRQQRLRGWRRCCEGAALLRGSRAAALPRHTQSPIGGWESPPSAVTQVPNPRLRRGIAFGSPIPAFGGDWRVDPQSRWGLCVSWVIQRCSSRNDSPSDSGRHSRCRRPDGYFYGRLRLAVQHREQVACSIWTAVHTAPPNLFWPLGNASND